MLEYTRADWINWNKDYFCRRPPVTCEGCGRHYGWDECAAVMHYENFKLIHCSDCDKPKVEKPKPQPVFPIPQKCVGRDVACRYIVRYDGKTFWHQTDADAGEIYLQDREGNVIAKVSAFDTFPKPVDTSEFDDIPF